MCGAVPVGWLPVKTSPLMPDAPRGSEAALQLAAALGIEPRSCIYLSTPITSGPAFMEWRQQLSERLNEDDRRYWLEHQQNVIAENEVRFAPIEKRFRETLPGIVVSPMHLHVAGWRQLDYHSFWAEFVRRWCKTVVLTEGWEYSTGCCVEALTALSEGLEILDQDLVPFDPATMASSIERARQDLVDLEMATDPYLEATTSLLRLLANIPGR